MNGLTGWLDQTFYPNQSKNWDDERLRERVLRRINSDTHLLDLGAGAGIVSQTNFRNLVARVCGIDPDPRVETNPYLHEAKVASGSCIPYPENTFDLVIADNVLEHLERPIEVFREVSRVLKPGGYFIAKTPNRSHYVPTIARATSISFHRLYNRLRGRDAEDTFPTYYRASSRSQIEALAHGSGLNIEMLELIEGRPEYLRLSPLTYLFGIVYERMVNLTSALANWRVLLIIQLRKPCLDWAKYGLPIRPRSYDNGLETSHAPRAFRMTFGTGTRAPAAPPRRRGPAPC
jgi:SAM-dependent methyltransferase